MKKKEHRGKSSGTTKSNRRYRHGVVRDSDTAEEHEDADLDDGVNKAGAAATTNKKKDHRGKFGGTTRSNRREAVRDDHVEAPRPPPEAAALHRHRDKRGPHPLVR